MRGRRLDGDEMLALMGQPRWGLQTSIVGQCGLRLSSSSKVRKRFFGEST